MEFTYKSYEKLVMLLQGHQFRISSYDDYKAHDKCVIIRHDVDNSLSKAMEFAEIEAGIGREGVKSTYFLLLTSGFYNVFSLSAQKIIDGILKCGHEIGLHFDEMRYPELLGSMNGICEKILQEADILSHVTGKPVTKVSMHRPDKRIIDANLQISGMVNTYSDEFFNGFKYLSDSRRNWREQVEEVVRSGSFNRIQILVHPFWYNAEETDMASTVKHFVNAANKERYDMLNDNFTRLDEVLSREEADGK